MRRLLIIAAALAAAGPGASAALAAEASLTSLAAKAASPAPSVTVVRASERQIVETIVVGGTLVAREEVLVAPEVDGLAVVEVLVEEGDAVEKGQVLARLATDQLEATLAQNAAEIARADAAIAQARTQIAEAEAVLQENRQALTRARKLNKQGFASDERLDQSVSGASVATARLNAARQAVTSAEAQKRAWVAQRRELEWRRSRTDVRAPVGGIVSARLLRVGQIAGMGGGPLLRIIEDGDIELEAEVSDVAMPRLATGQAVLVAPAGLSDPVRGKVRLVSAEIDRTTRLGRVRVWLPRDARLKIGAYARGTIEVERRSGVTVPLAAVSYGDSATFIQVVNDAVVESRPVELGYVNGETAEIRRGLREGEDVVARAGAFLRDGDAVMPVLVEAEAASQ
jgi:RND family efflux transporter MFP subunit